jgi:glucose-6-phosphate 1-dehydrogenase
MYKNVFLFGARGHLAQTKLIPALKNNKMNYISLSRSNIQNLNKYKNDRNIAYMSIPSQNFIECISPYQDFIKENKPLFVIEKPHGITYSNFLELQSFFDLHKLNVIYNDHYVAKNALLNLNDLPHINDVRKIEVKLHESSCVNDRLNYFDQVGILLDMYQSHVLIILSTILARMENKNREKVLCHIAKCIPFHKYFSKYESYEGQNFTRCYIEFIYKGIGINVSCGKKLTDEKSLCISTNDGRYLCIDLSNTKGNPYDNIFEWLNNDDTERFLNKKEIGYMWKHINLF